MPAKRQKLNSAFEIENGEEFTEAKEELALSLITTILANDIDAAKALVSEKMADSWFQDDQGWTALHAAASIGNLDLCTFLLRSGNGVWNLTDALGNTAGDIAFSLNESEVYQFLLQEGIRSEMLKAVMAKLGLARNNDDEDEDEEMTTEGLPITTASDNATFLASPLIFTKDDSGQEICVDLTGTGVMMGWERGLMKESAEKMCKAFEGRKGRVVDLESEEEEEMSVVNVGFGLGIIDSFLQEYSPSYHLIIEPHPDVLAHAKSKGWYNKPGVVFYEGTWKQYLQDQEDEKEEYKCFDVVYFDTYSEHYQDLHEFFDVLPNWLRSNESRFSFFHGLGATSRTFYDVYTTVSELHLKEIGLDTEWSEVDLSDAVGAWEGVERRYWNEVGPYRLPLCRLSEI